MTQRGAYLNFECQSSQQPGACFGSKVAANFAAERYRDGEQLECPAAGAATSCLQLLIIHIIVCHLSRIGSVK